MQKGLREIKAKYKKLKKSIDSDASDSSYWFLTPRTLKSINKIRRIRIIKNPKIKNKLYAKSADAKFILNKISNKLDKVVSKNMRMRKLSNLDLTNEVLKDGTPVNLASVYNPNDIKNS